MKTATPWRGLAPAGSKTLPVSVVGELELQLVSTAHCQFVPLSQIGCIRAPPAEFELPLSPEVAPPPPGGLPLDDAPLAPPPLERRGFEARWSLELLSVRAPQPTVN